MATKTVEQAEAALEAVQLRIRTLFLEQEHGQIEIGSPEHEKFKRLSLEILRATADLKEAESRT